MKCDVRKLDQKQDCGTERTLVGKLVKSNAVYSLVNSTDTHLLVLITILSTKGGS